MKERTSARSSLLRYDMALNKHLLPKFGDVKIRRLTAEILDNYYAALRKAGMADNSIRWQDDLVSNVCRCATRSLKWIETNPVADANPEAWRDDSARVSNSSPCSTTTTRAFRSISAKTRPRRSAYAADARAPGGCSAAR